VTGFDWGGACPHERDPPLHLHGAGVHHPWRHLCGRSPTHRTPPRGFFHTKKPLFSPSRIFIPEHLMCKECALLASIPTSPQTLQPRGGMECPSVMVSGLVAYTIWTADALLSTSLDFVLVRVGEELKI